MEGAGGGDPDGVGCQVSGDTCLRVSPQLSPRLSSLGLLMQAAHAAASNVPRAADDAIAQVSAFEQEAEASTARGAA